MRFVACDVCKVHLQLGGDPQEIENILKMSSVLYCVTPFCSAVMHLTEAVAKPGYTRKEMPIRNFYRAINGFGSGIGDPASYSRARELLLSRKIVGVVGEPTGQPERVILRQLVLEGGITMHFDSSALGACLYYIEEPGPTCTEVVDNELSISPNPKSSSSAREEDRRTDTSSEGIGYQDAGPNVDSKVRSDGAILPNVPTTNRVPTSKCEGAGEPGGHHGGDRPDLRL